MFNANDADFDRKYYYANDELLLVSVGHKSEKHL